MAIDFCVVSFINYKVQLQHCFVLSKGTCFSCRVKLIVTTDFPATDGPIPLLI